MSTTKVQSDMVDIDGATTATIVAGDKINFLDITDSLVKEDTVQGILDLAGGGFTVATEQATTSGTSVTFGSIPSGTTMITINFEGVSLDGTEHLLVQLGDAGGLETSAYLSTSCYMKNGNVVSGSGSTAGFIMVSQEAVAIFHGHMILTLKDSTNFTWTSSHSNIQDANGVVNTGGGSKSLSAELTQVAILDTGSDSFDAGSINIMYQ